MWRSAGSRVRALCTNATAFPSGGLTCSLRAYSADTDAARNAEKLLEIMANSPALQQMMMASLPSHLRNNPDVIKAMLNDPGVKQKIADMIAKQGVKLPTAALDKLSATDMEATFNRMKRVGINPVELPQKLMAYPEIFKKLQEPAFMQAFLETAENPAAAAKYPQEVMSVVSKAQEVLRTRSQTLDTPPQVQEAQVISHTQHSAVDPASPAAAGPSQAPPPPLTPAAPQSPPAPASAPTTQLPPTAGGVPFMHLLSQDPTLAAKLQNPRVQKALEEISKSPWKTVKYVFDKEVMEVFTALNKMLKTGGK